MALQVKTLESDIKEFADSLPYWGKFLSKKILEGGLVQEIDIDSSYSYLLEDLSLVPKTERPAINLSVSPSGLNGYKEGLRMTGLSELTGVNALCEKQTIKFSPNLTVIYGDNGSGKSGYTRLLKQAYYSKAPEEIMPNVYAAGTPKKPSAKFTFSCGDAEAVREFPTQKADVEFRQFSVFDGKSVLKHLENRNQFEFRPAGLNYFGLFTDCVRRLEVKLNAEAATKNRLNNFIALFDGTSEIKTILETLSSKTDIEQLKKHLPYSEEDAKGKAAVQKQYDDLMLAGLNKEKEISMYAKIKIALEGNKQKISVLNKYFTEEHLSQARKAVEDWKKKAKIAEKEGADSFTVDSIKDVGSPEWKNFISAANAFANKQSAEYPTNEDICLLCNQPLSSDAKTLVLRYWAFIKSEAEKEAKVAEVVVEKGVAVFEKLNFDLMPEGNALTQWLSDFAPQSLEIISAEILKISNLSGLVVAQLKTGKLDDTITASQACTAEQDRLILEIDEKVKTLSDDSTKELIEGLKAKLDFYNHKEKLALHIEKIGKFVEDQKWLAKANKVSWGKKGITETEKALAAKYFNKSYVDTFNAECGRMNGAFGIAISHTGAGGTSYRQLFIQGKNPAAILSDGEQKVIALADFLTEMNQSPINQGIIFDDPVTSLDHGRRDTIAKRLVQEAKTKQVVVFTHDVVFLLALKHYASTLAVPHVSVSLFKAGELAGLTKPSLPWIAANVSVREGYLNGELQRITKLHKTVDPDEYRKEVKGWCEQLREAWERCVEERLFKGVVSRFSPGIQTQRLKKVVISSDLINEINDGMTVTSAWIHDQGAGLNSPTPEPETLATWAAGFSTFIKKCKPE